MQIGQSSIRRILIACVMMAALLPIMSTVHPAQAGGVVTNCSSDSQFSSLLAGGGTITFNCGTALINLSSPKTINANTTIDGGGQITLSGQDVRQLFYVNSGASLTLRNIVLTNAYSSGDGGAIYNSFGIVTLANSTIRNSKAGASGGAIVSYGVLTITDSLLENNQALNGGAVYPRWSGSQTTIINSVLRGNKATDTTDGWGGALLAWDGAPVTFKDSVIDNNTAREGGGIYNFANSVLTMTNSFLSGNSATNGGGVLNYGTVTLTGATLSGNSAQYGGGMLNYSTATLTNVTLSGNTATLWNGGGVDNAGIVTMTNVTLVGNTAAYGGGLLNVGTATLTNATLSGNSATQGGALHNYDGTSTLTHVTFSGNKANTNGGVIYLYAGSVNVKNSIVANSLSGGNCSGSITNDGFNLSSDNTCSFGPGRDNVDVMLGPLADNGGPTLTHKPQAGSPAIDLITIGCPPPATDQRGARRPFNGRCDAGAVEYGSPVVVVGLPVVLKNYFSYFEGPDEVEPNNSLTQANGALHSGRAYHGHPSQSSTDPSDYFSIYLATTGNLNATVTNFYADGDLVLRNSAGTILTRWGGSGNKPLTMVVTATGLPSAWYYIQVYVDTSKPVTPNQAYTLTATYP